MAKSRHNQLKIWSVVFFTLMLLVLIFGWYIKSTVFKQLQLTETAYIYITPETDYEGVIAQIKKSVELPSEKIFEILSEQMKYPQSVKTGRYAIENGMTVPELIRVLRAGSQSPTRITFNNMRTKEDLVGRISEQLMLDSLSLLSALNDSNTIANLGFDSNNVVAMFIPNTYEVYWDTSVEKLLRRIQKEYNSFWNDNRKAKAEKIGLKPIEVSTLASIVEEEATYTDEYPIVAGLYLNRLKRGQRLEADPTVKFALQDFGLRRIPPLYLTGRRRR